MSPQGHTGGGGHRFQLRTPEWPWVFVPVAQGPGYEKAGYILSSTPPPSLPPLNRVFPGRIQDRAVGTQGRGCGFRGRLKRHRGAVGGCRILGGVSACWAPTGITRYGWFTLLSCIFTYKWGSEKLRATRCSLSHCPRSANSHLPTSGFPGQSIQV